MTASRDAALQKGHKGMVKRILFCASSLSHIKNFHLPYLEAFRRKGYEIWVAANGAEPLPQADYVIDVPFCKSFGSPRNARAALQLWKLLYQTPFDLLSTHTALASAVVRLAVLLTRKSRRPRVVVTCHGYLFHETDSRKKWAYLLPEKICAPVTDALMVMNQEDLEIAKKHRLASDKLYFIRGMGFQPEKFVVPTREDRTLAREKMGFGQNDFLFLCAAEFSKRKDQASLIRAFLKFCHEAPSAYLLLAGDGALRQDCQKLAEACPGRVRFFGQVENMAALYPLCDCAVTASHIEGLPFNVLEALFCGLPVIARDTKGHRDLIADHENGLLYRQEAELTASMDTLYRDRALYARLSGAARESVAEYTLPRVLPEIMRVYEDVVRQDLLS